MKTQISKQSYQPAKRYSGVYQQQGRMLTDADWGELMDLVKQTLDDALHDLVDTGAPRERGVTIEDHGRIDGTHIYADGVKAIVAPKPAADGSPGATPFAYSAQADFPDAPALPPPSPNPQAQAVRLYGDVWERVVIALEDEQLRDPALHGADTCTRTQTMAQIKWCPAGTDPRDDTANPQKGNALANVEIHAKRAETDPCDPCADVVAPDARIGNYLFRVEVHDVVGPQTGPDEITLKWSSENGAEQYAVDAATDDFKSGDWVWEFYDLTSEKHLGVHLANGFAPKRGVLVTAFPASPATDADVKELPFVRRWDGYVVLERAADGTYTPAVDADGIQGKDKNVQLSEASDSTDTSHGAILSGGTVKINLENLTLTVELAGKTLVAGDYWLAVVREDVHNVGDTVLEDVEPLGILHHYVELAQLQDDGTLLPVEPGSPPWRKLHFPPLTDIDANDVGYVTDCPSGLFTADHDTVKKALDQVCQISAEQIAFTKPCDTSLYENVPAASIDTVAKALGLLCDIRAEHIAYNAEAQCELLSDAETVKEALDILCERPAGGGCKTSVGRDGDFPTILEAIAALSKSGPGDTGLIDFNLCLLPGIHELPPQAFFDELGAKISGLYSLSLCGSGVESTFLRIDEPTRLDLHTFCVHDLAIVNGERSVNLSLLAEEIRFRHVIFDVSVDDARIVGLILDGRHQIQIADCIIVAHIFDSLVRPSEVFDGIGILQDLFADGAVVANRVKFLREVLRRAEHLAEPNQQNERKSIAKQVSTVIQTGQLGLTAEEIESYESFIESLRLPNANSPSLARRLAGDLDRIRFAAAGAAAGRVGVVAAVVASAMADVIFDHDDIIGQLSIYGLPPTELPDLGQMHEKLRPQIADQVLRFGSTQRTLQFCNNHLTQLLVSQKMIDELFEFAGTEHVLDGLFETALLSDNVFRTENNFLIAKGHSLTATRFDHEPLEGGGPDAGIVIGDNAVYVGTVGKSEHVRFQNGGETRGEPVVFADINLFDTTRRQGDFPKDFPTDTATFRLAIV